MAITRQTLQLQTALQADLTKVTDQQTRALTSAWVDAWDEVSGDLQAALLTSFADDAATSAAQLARSSKLIAALRVVSRNLGELVKQARVTITGDMDRIVEQAAAAQAAIARSQLPDSHADLLVDGSRAASDRALEAIVKRTTEQVTSLSKPIAPETYQVVRRELIRGVAAGSNPKKTAARMVSRAEDRFNFGLTRAMVISRTETLDAHRTAAGESQALHADVLAGWLWLAKLDARTCRSCWSQHGILHPLTEAGPLDHQQGRCARMPKTKTWSQLGILGVDEPADVTPDAAAQFAQLSQTDQQAILGTSGYKAWLDGMFPPSAWSKKHTSDGWRDSYRPAPAPKF